MKNLLLTLCIILGIVSCSSIRPIVIQDNTQVTTIDSIIWHDTTVVSYITKERIVDVTNIYDTLNLETDYAKATSYVDTLTRSLKGSIENKSTIPVYNTIKWKEKISYRDSIQIKEVPVEVEVIETKYPTTYWIFMGITILVLLYTGIKIYLKFKI